MYWSGVVIAAVLARFGDRQGKLVPIADDALKVLILACDRHDELDMSLYALGEAHLARSAHVVVSVDCIVPWKFYDMIRSHSSRFNTLKIQSSYQQHVEPDAWKDERVARHWISAISRMFYDGAERVLYLEEDHVAMPDIFLAANRFDNACPSCFAVNLACHKPCGGMYTTDQASAGIGVIGNIAVVYYKSKWLDFIRRRHRFCSVRGDWDYNLKWLYQYRCLQVYKPRAYHLHDCRSARTKRLEFNGKYCNKRRELYMQFRTEWSSTPSGVPRINMQRQVSEGIGQTATAPDRMRERCLEAAEHWSS